MQTNKKIVIATHQMLYGSAQALRDYLLNKKTNTVLFIGHPLVMQRQSSCNFYKNGRKIDETVVNRRKSFGFLDYAIDFFLTLWWVWKQKQTYDIFIGVDGLNCLAGLFLRKISKVKKVIFYSIDFSPVRFKNSIINAVYHKIEKFCVVSSDDCWNVSPRIAEGREQFLHISSKQYRQRIVPIGIWNDKIKKVPFGKIKKHQLLFVGHLLEKQGVQKALEAVPLIVKEIPDFKFLIVGGGEYKNDLQKLVLALGIEQYVELRGWIKERKLLDDVMSESACAIAAYKPEKEKLFNFTYYADPTKLKDYLGAGLPIILTDVSYNAKDMEKRKCGIIVDYDKNKIANAITILLNDEKKLMEYRANAIAFARDFDWNFIFSKALQ